MSEDDVFVGFLCGLFVMGLVAFLIVSTNVPISKTLFSATGETFCKSFGLQYDTWEMTNDKKEFRFVCVNTTVTKVDGVGVLGGVGTAK